MKRAQQGAGPASGDRGLLASLAAELERCNKCGFCLAACPTYRAEPVEWSVTRGRVSLIQDVLAGRLDLHDPGFREALETCLMCRACVSACPAQVEIGALISRSRAERRQEAGFSLVERLIYRGLLPRPRLAATLSTLAAPLDRPALRRLAGRVARAGGGSPLGRALALGPRLPGTTGRRLIAAEGRSGRVGRPQDSVVYFLGCSKNLFFPRAALATYRLLRRQGIHVEVPVVACCGLPDFSAGDLEGARALARQNLAMLEGTGARTIVVDESSCCSHLLSYGELFAGLGEEEPMSELVGRFVDLTVFLDRVGIEPPGPKARRVVWHDPCHLRHHQKVTEAPRRVLARVPGTVLVEPDIDPGCCGGAGSIMLTKGELSDALLEARLRAYRAAGAELIVTGSPSCVAQYARATGGLPVQYLSEYLESAYRPTGAGE
jgi:glycolate oxidase iron-sulfur subunit